MQAPLPAPLQERAKFGGRVPDTGDDVGESGCLGLQLDPVLDLPVLTSMLRGLLGAPYFHKVLQTARGLATIRKSEVERFGRTYRVGDEALRLERDYSEDVFNGNLGFVPRAAACESEVTVHGDGRPVVYDFSEFDELVLTDTLSIHQNQGSGSPARVILMHPEHRAMLQRHLPCTGIIRGQRLVGLARVGGTAVQQAEAGRRCMGLEWRRIPD